MRKLTIATALLAATAFAGTAHAAVNITSYTGNPGYLTGNLSYTPTALVLNGVGIGRFEMNGVTAPGGDPVSYLTYCIDIFHTVHTGQFDIQPLSTLVTDSLRQQQLLTLISNTDPLLSSGLSLAQRRNISAATQLAVWEIAFEGSGTYSLLGGDLKVSGGTSGTARTLANDYLNKIVTNEWTPVAGQKLELLYSQSNQSQVFLSAAVPEPATWAMMIGGFGLIGAAARRRRRTTVTYA